MRIPTARALIRPLQAAVVGLIVSNLIITILWIVQCRPLEGAWDSDVKAKCFSRGQLQRIIMAQAGQLSRKATPLQYANIVQSFR